MRTGTLWVLSAATSCLIWACETKTTPETSTSISVKAAPPAQAETNATPQPPSGPVPIPYPNVVAKPEGSGKAQKISGKEVGLKNGSKLQKSTGD